MLLLVLILVLIAFGLLVVALLTGSVLWAWVSVGVSVLAAVVLLIDWLQRRNVVKAGSAAAQDASAAPHHPRMAAPEPLTEVLPVVPPPGSQPGGDGVSAGAAPVQHGASEAQFDPSADATKTVVMPVVQPSASTERPSGASPETTWTSGDSSQTVTKAGSARSTVTPSHGDAEGGAPAEDSGSGGTDAAPDGAGQGTGGQASAAERAATPGDSDAQSGEQPATPAAAAADSGTAPPTDAPSAAPPAQGEVAGATGRAAVEGAPDTAADAAAEAQPPPADGEPPEEERDPAAAALVAGLDTEVLVIDEQPRYHMSGCAALAGKALIPLPAREAVELGFTPCGWCTPDRTLAAQQTAAR